MGGVTPFWERPIETLNKAEWEALCDGCGKCCLHKIEEEWTGHIYPTNVACHMLDRHTAKCMDYPNRKRHVPDCLQLTPKKLLEIEWLPMTCAYRLRAEALPLPEWHYLVSGDPESVHKAGQSVRGWTISETDAGPLENHLVEREV